MFDDVRPHSQGRTFIFPRWFRWGRSPIPAFPKGKESSGSPIPAFPKGEGVQREPHPNLPQGEGALSQCLTCGGLANYSFVIGLNINCE